MTNEREIWERRYSQGQAVNRYPFDLVVSFVLRRFSKLPPEERKDARILDYGCGTGAHAGFIADEGFDYYGIDYSDTAARITEETLAEHGVVSPEDKVTCGDFGQLPYSDEFFDLVIDRQSLGQNAADKLPAMVAEIHRVLKVGGSYFGVNFSAGHPQLSWGRSLGNGDYTEFSEGTFKGLGLRHFFDKEELESLFASFDVEDIRLISNTSLLGKGGESEQIVLTASRK